MIIGVDFDNTMVCYNALFHRVAVEQGLIPADILPIKDEVRNYLRQTGREADWTAMQGYVYGERMPEAEPFAGVAEFFTACRRQDVPVYIISHKTRHPFAGPRYDLHQAAWNWLTAHAFFNPDGVGLTADKVFFELTKEEKFGRIAAVHCTHFIDDLPEFLTDAQFPAGVHKILFSPGRLASNLPGLLQSDSWANLATTLLV